MCLCVRSDITRFSFIMLGSQSLHGTCSHFFSVYILHYTGFFYLDFRGIFVSLLNNSLERQTAIRDNLTKTHLIYNQHVNMSRLASLPGVQALSTFASHWLVDREDLTVVTMGMDDIWGNQQQLKKTQKSRGEKRVNRKESFGWFHTVTQIQKFSFATESFQPKHWGLRSPRATWNSTDSYGIKRFSRNKAKTDKKQQLFKSKRPVNKVRLGNTGTHTLYTLFQRMRICTKN